MFNIKSIVNKITDRGRDSQPNSPGRGSQEDDSLSKDAEGFLCPKCMKAFLSPEDLQYHYESSHSSGAEASLDSSGLSNAHGFSAFHQEVGERYKHIQEVSASPQDISNTQGKALVDHIGVVNITNVEELQKRLQEVLKNKAELQIEKEHLEQRAAQLARDNVALKAASDEGEGNQVALKERLKIVEAQLAHRESIDDAAVLRQELVQVQRVMDELTREKERELQQLKDKYAAQEDGTSLESQRLLVLQAKVDKKEEDCAELKRQLELKELMLIELEDKYEKESSKVKNLEKQWKSDNEHATDELHQYKEQVERLLQVQLQNQNLQTSLEELRRSTADELKNKDLALTKLTAKIECFSTSLEKANSELLALQADHESLNSENYRLKEDISLKSEMCEHLENCNTAKENKIVEGELAIARYKDDIDRLEGERKELLAQIQAGEGANTAIQQLSQENRLLQLKLKDQAEKYTKQVQEATMKIESFSKDLTDSNLKYKEAQNELLQFKKVENERLMAKSTEIQNLKDQLDQKESQFSIEVAELNTKIKTLQGTIAENDAKAKSQFKGMQETLGSLEGELQSAKKKAEELEGMKNEQEKNIKNNENWISELQANSAELQRNLQDSLSRITNLTEKLKESQDKCEFLVTEKEKQLHENKAMQEKITNLEEQLQMNGVHVTSLETSLFELQKHLAEVEDDKKHLEDTSRKEIESLKKYISEKVEVIDKHEETKKMILSEKSELSSELVSLQKCFEETEAKLKESVTKLESQLSEELQAKKKLQDELMAKCATIENLNEQLKELQDTVEVTVRAKDEEIRIKCSTVDELAGEKLALEAQLEASQSEQKTLLERYYTSNTESDNLRRTIAELRRSLEESQAALHELGRENQTLHLELEKLCGRKWTEDSDVKGCSHCEKEFSFVVRKHHCRNCLKIFCNECSSKMAPLATNKKAVRVCDSCYNELALK